MSYDDRETDAFIVYNRFHFECKTCGKVWRTEGKKTGFVKAAAERHANACRARAPKPEAANG